MAIVDTLAVLDGGSGWRHRSTTQQKLNRHWIMVDNSMVKQRIAFLGTGLMGFPMATNLLKAGFEVTAWNRTREKAEPLGEQGAKIAAAVQEAVADADMVITMLENGPIVEDVVFGNKLPGHARKGTLFLDVSSITPGIARDHAERLEAAGMEHLDAPVSGGTAGAEAGSLAIMVGGKEVILERASGVFKAMGTAKHVGPHGSGQLAKAANQTIVAVTIGVVSEALLFASAGGADPAAVRQALQGGFADSRILELHGQRMLDRNFVPGGAARNQLKDLRTALDSAAESGLTLPVTEKVTELFTAMIDGGREELDHSALLLELEDMNQGKRVTDKPDQLPG